MNVQESIARHLPASVGKTNVSQAERIAMVTLGAYLLYKGTQKEKCWGKITIGTAILLRGVSGYCPVYDAVDHLKNEKGTDVTIHLQTVVNKPVADVYAFWRNLENLPRFMKHLESVKTINPTLSEWTAKGPAGIGTLTWKAAIAKEEKEKMLSWQSLPDSGVTNSGKVLFKANGQSTELDITISYEAPMGAVGAVAAKFLTPYFEKLIREDVTNFKDFMEVLQK
ncbi:SRPBCC family protein [Flavobacterium orientale]|uniref:Cyclase n=1 Tax=Flavobacterium orientale TaxID=1756020 RepID=A0A916Y9A9_9FLAO|nr:SRPBCC family protein [Flavobacterium orientale]GGD35148.1 hypothetical protein GCM10011343_26260 [Flavobacterium orientale]